MRALFTKIKDYLEQRTSYEQFIDSANNVKESEDRMRSLGSLNMNLLYLSRC